MSIREGQSHHLPAIRVCGILSLMHRYTAYGLSVESEIALPELVAAEISRAQSDADGRCSIVLGRAPEAATHASCDTPLIWARRGDACLRYADVATYHVTAGTRIVIDPAPASDERVIRLFLLGPALAVLLHQRGLLVLHASSVAIDGGAIAFAGEKGEGKSTLAAAMHARGHPLVADDVLAIDLDSSDHASVYSGFPQLKLAPDSAAQLSDNPHELPRVHPDFEKRVGRVTGGFAADKSPLDGIIVLQTAEEERLQPLPPQRTFVELVRHSYLAPMLQSTGESEAHFRQVVELARRVPVFELQRRRDMGLLDQTARMIEAQVRRAR